MLTPSWRYRECGSIVKDAVTEGGPGDHGVRIMGLGGNERLRGDGNGFRYKWLHRFH